MNTSTFDRLNGRNIVNTYRKVGGALELPCEVLGANWRPDGGIIAVYGDNRLHPSSLKLLDDACCQSDIGSFQAALNQLDLNDHQWTVQSGLTMGNRGDLDHQTNKVGWYLATRVIMLGDYRNSRLDYYLVRGDSGRLIVAEVVVNEHDYEVTMPSTRALPIDGHWLIDPEGKAARAASFLHDLEPWLQHREAAA